MTLADKTVGLVLLGLSATIFSYYTLWVVITPFVDEDHFIQNYFPDRYYAIMIPTMLLIVGITGIVTFISTVMIKTANKKKQKTQ